MSTPLPAEREPQPADRSRDLVVATDFTGWVAGVAAVVRRDFVPLALLQLAALAVQLVAALLIGVVLFAWLGPDGPGLLDGTVPSERIGQLLTSANAIMAGLMALVLVVITMAATALSWAAPAFVIVRRAAGQPAGLVAGVRAALPRALPLVGWSVVIFVLFLPVMALAFVPFGLVLALPLALYLGTVFAGTALGVVVVEKGGLGRCFALVHGRSRFFATLSRTAFTTVATVPYVLIVVAVGSGLGDKDDFLPSLVNGVLVIPAAVVMIAAMVVTYAELRGREDEAVTGATLAAELAGAARA